MLEVPQVVALQKLELELELELVLELVLVLVLVLVMELELEVEVARMVVNMLTPHRSTSLWTLQ